VLPHFVLRLHNSCDEGVYWEARFADALGLMSFQDILAVVSGPTAITGERSDKKVELAWLVF
jgi:hypothetical protein